MWGTSDARLGCTERGTVQLCELRGAGSKGASILRIVRLAARMQLHATYSTNTQSLLVWVFEHLRLPPTCRLLEVGCGAGQLSLVNQCRIPAGWDITLADFSAGMLATAQRQLRACGHAFQFVVHDAQALPFTDKSFEAVIANHMLYHVPDRPAAYAKFRRVLTPSGRLYAATNSKDNMRELDTLIQRFRHTCASDSGTTGPLSDFRLPHGFNLEHGAAELSQWFSSVTLHRYTDALVVPEAGAVGSVCEVDGTLDGR
jgi:ubiquinone/menaquinone biosynthesis C-methylase UbiE